MASRKHENTAAELTKPHEDNEIQLKGIVWFGGGLVVLIVVTFVLMWAFLNVLKDYNEENQGQKNPMQMSQKEKLPPEPRLQLAPGFGVESERGRVNMELGEPQAEYRELHKQWLALWEHGQKDAATGVTRMMPIEEAIDKFVAQNPKSNTSPDAAAVFSNSSLSVTDQSARSNGIGEKKVRSVKSEKLKMKSLGQGVSRRSICLTLFVFSFSLFTLSVFAQKAEHYNSPLYSPRYYDPATSEPIGLPQPLKEVGIEQKLGEQLPLDTELKDENGNSVRLGDYFTSGRPVIVAFVYYECPMLCNQVLNGLTGSLKGINLDAGKDFDVVAISFDSARENDKADLAKNKKANYVERYGRPGADKGFHFLTGSQDSIDKATSAAGFHYKWDEKSQQFAHAAAVMIATPEGRLSRYFFGIDYGPKDIKFGLMDSSANKVGSTAEQLLLYCYHYDPATGKYGLAILRVMRLGGIATILGLGAMAFVFWRRNKKKDIGSGGAEGTTA